MAASGHVENTYVEEVRIGLFYIWRLLLMLGTRDHRTSRGLEHSHHLWYL